MSKSIPTPAVGQTVHYFAEGHSVGQAHSGPFAAIISAVGPKPEEGQPWRVDLAVFYPASGRPQGEEHQKVAVPQAAYPTKHHWCWPLKA